MDVFVVFDGEIVVFKSEVSLLDTDVTVMKFLAANRVAIIFNVFNT